jgi:hypothetical protein
MNACDIYDNYIYGDPGTHTNTFIFASASATGSSINNLHVFNNLLTNTATALANTPANGLIQIWVSNGQVYNNTLIGNGQNQENGLGNTSVAISNNPGKGLILQNNIISNFYLGLYTGSGATYAVSDGNDFSNLIYTGTDNTNTYYQTLADYQTCTKNGCPAIHDTHSISAAPNLNSSYQPQSSSPTNMAGFNLTSVGITNLDLDRADNPRPPGTCSTQGTPSCWGMGAYQFVSSAAPPTPGTALTAQAY